MAPRVGSRPLVLLPCSARPLSPPRPCRTVCSAPRQAAPPPPHRLLRPSLGRSARPAPAAPSAPPFIRSLRPPRPRRSCAPPFSRPRRPPRPRCPRLWRGPSAAPEVLGQPRAARPHACPGSESTRKKNSPLAAHLVRRVLYKVLSLATGTLVIIKATGLVFMGRSR